MTTIGKQFKKLWYIYDKGKKQNCEEMLCEPRCVYLQDMLSRKSKELNSMCMYVYVQPFVQDMGRPQLSKFISKVLIWKLVSMEVS